ncbi:MAG: energy-coupling factor transporter transmembrane component T family protein [Smithella sp.]
MKYLDKETFIHRLDPRTKIILGLMVAILIVVLKNPLGLLLLFSSVLILFGILRPAKRTIKAMLIIMVTALVFTMISQGFFYTLEPRTIIITILSPYAGLPGKITGGIVLYREGIIYGALQSLRLFSAMLLSAVIVMSTYPSDLLLGMESMGMPERIGFVITVSIRFIPSLSDEARRIFLAQRMRGLKVKGIRGWFRAFYRLLPPLIIDSLRNARRIALAAEVRAFNGNRTKLKELKFSLRDWTFLGFSTAGMFMLILCQEILP